MAAWPAVWVVIALEQQQGVDAVGPCCRPREIHIGTTDSWDPSRPYSQSYESNKEASQRLREYAKCIRHTANAKSRRSEPTQH